MKKLLLSTFVAVLGVGSVNAQLLSEDFATEIPSTWTIIDVDGITSTSSQSAYASWAWNAGDASSSSWYDNNGAGPTDDWLITPGIVVPASGTFQVEFDASSHEANYLEEYEVLYSTTGATVADFTAAPILDVVNEAEAGTFRTAILPGAVNGQTVYIAIHHTSSDESMLHIDNFVVRELLADDIQMVSLSMQNTVVAGPINITGTVKNNGANPISSFTLSYDAGAGAVSETVNQTIAPGVSYNFTHGTPLVAVSGTTYNLTVCATMAADLDNSNDCISSVVSAVSSVVQKVTVGEEKTGEWCGWCPRGAVALAQMELSNPNDFIGIAVHNADPMAVASYDGNIGTYVPGGYPGAGVDRTEVGGPENFATMHAARASMIPPASIDASASVSGNTITVTVTANFVGGLSGDYRLAAVLVEDNVTGTSQANYYDDGAAGAMAYPNTGSMPNFNWVGAGANVSPVWHDHVARALGADEINGSAGSLPAVITAGSTETYTYTFTADASWKLYDMHVVGMLVNGSTGEILNAGKSDNAVSLTEINATDFDLNVMPNPTSGVTAIVLNLEEAADVNMVIVDIVGNVVFNSGTNNLAAGTYPTSIDLSDQADGIYFAKVSVNGAVKTVKINLAK